VLVGASALALILLGRPGDAVPAGITTAVVMVAAALSPQHAWQQPMLRLADTIVGTAVAIAAAWAGIRARRLLHAGQQAPPEAPQQAITDTPNAPAKSVRITPGPSGTEQAHEDHS
jgi:multisubunit Na+/H+ antiporter MnhB subunit